jgi:hypothetical protein
MLQQFGMYRSNLVSVRQLADYFMYCHLNILIPENVKAVVEYNTYGGQFLAKCHTYLMEIIIMVRVYSYRYKHRINSEEEE